MVKIKMRMLAAICVCLFCCGCTVRYSSIQSHDDKTPPIILQGAIKDIVSAYLDVVIDEFEGANIQLVDYEKGRLFFFGRGKFLRGDVQVTIQIKKIIATTEASLEVEGYLVEITSRAAGGDKSMFPGYAIKNINDALPAALKNYKIKVLPILAVR